MPIRSIQSILFALTSLLIIQIASPLLTGHAETSPVEGPHTRRPALLGFVEETSRTNNLLQSRTQAPGVIGIDLKIYKKKHPPLIEDVFPGSPAARAGLKTGDLILAVDGVLLDGLSREAVDQQISDEVGKPVEFTVERHNQVQQITVIVGKKSMLPVKLQTFIADLLSQGK